MTAPPPDPPAPPGWADVGVVLAVVLLPAVHGGLVEVVWPEVVPRHPPVAYYETTTLALLAGWAALALYLVRQSGRPPADFGLARLRWSDPFWAACLFPLAWWAGGLSEHRPDLYLLPPTAAGQFALVAIGCPAVGFTEELAWRGYLLTRVEALTSSTWQAVLFTAALFGLAHLYQGAGGVVGAGLHRLLSGVVFALTRRLGPVALEHAGYNLLVATWNA